MSSTTQMFFKQTHNPQKNNPKTQYTPNTIHKQNYTHNTTQHITKQHNTNKTPYHTHTINNTMQTTHYTKTQYTQHNTIKAHNTIFKTTQQRLNTLYKQTHNT